MISEINQKTSYPSSLPWLAKHLPDDWNKCYGYRPVLLETFVESYRFRGTCYKAANWKWVGQTKGRGKLDVHNAASLPKKNIWLYPLTPTFRQLLGQSHEIFYHFSRL